MEQIQWVTIGIGFIFLGVLIVIISSFFSQSKPGESKVAVVGFLGFIPFGFGNDKKWLVVGIVLTIICVLASIYFSKIYP